MWVVPTRLPLGQKPGEGLWSTDTLGRHQSSSSSITLWQVPPIGSGHQSCPLVGISRPPQEATACKRRLPAHPRPTESGYCPSGQPQWTRLRAETHEAEGVSPSENLPLGHYSRCHLILRPGKGPQRG